MNDAVPMSQSEFARLLAEIQGQEFAVREAGQREYAHLASNAFENFDDAARSLHLTREQVLLVLAHKHWRGIVSFVNGHRSQREDIRGRIKDLRMYLALLWGMVEADERANAPDTRCHQDAP